MKLKTIMKIKTLLPVLCLLLTLPSGISLADMVEDHLAFFEGACLRNMHDISLVEKMAVQLEWAEGSEKVRNGMFKRKENILGVWVIPERGILATSKSFLNSEPFSVCALITKYNNPFEIVEKFKILYKAKLVDDDIIGSQRYQVFEVSIDGQDMLVSAVTATHPSAKEMLNLMANFPIPESFVSNSQEK